MSGARLIVEASWAALPGGVRPEVAIVIEEGRIRAIEDRSTLSGANGVRVGGDGLLALPGLVNAHQHGQPDPRPAMGVGDAPLECWLVSLLAVTGADPYAETLRLCPQLARSGTTTAVHFHYRGASTAEAYEAELRAILSGYRDGGIRGVVACDIRDRGQPVFGETGAFLATLPSSLAERARCLVQPGPAVAEMLEVVRTLRGEAKAGLLGDVDVVLGPPGPPWCSDGLFTAVGETAARYDIPIHTHLLETWYEREFGLRQESGGSVAALRRLGVLTERLFVAHGVWLDADERSALAEAGVSVVTNPSSNLRLHAGIAPVLELLAAGVNVAIGTDNLSLAERDDLLGEIRLLRALHRQPGIDEQGLDAQTCLRIASENGGQAIGRDDVGTLRPGAVGDVALIDVARLRRSPLADPLDVAVACAAPEHVASVVAGGRILTHDEPGDGPPVNDQTALHEIVAELLPRVRSHYRSWHRPGDTDGIPPARARPNRGAIRAQATASPSPTDGGRNEIR